MRRASSKIHARGDKKTGVDTSCKFAKPSRANFSQLQRFKNRNRSLFLALDASRTSSRRCAARPVYDELLSLILPDRPAGGASEWCALPRTCRAHARAAASNCSLPAPARMPRPAPVCSCVEGRCVLGRGALQTGPLISRADWGGTASLTRHACRSHYQSILDQAEKKMSERKMSEMSGPARRAPMSSTRRPPTQQQTGSGRGIPLQRHHPPHGRAQGISSAQEEDRPTPHSHLPRVCETPETAGLHLILLGRSSRATLTSSRQFGSPAQHRHCVAPPSL